MEHLNKLLMHFECNTILGVELQASFELLITELGLSSQPLQLPHEKYSGRAMLSWLKIIWEKFN